MSVLPFLLEPADGDPDAAAIYQASQLLFKRIHAALTGGLTDAIERPAGSPTPREVMQQAQGMTFGLLEEAAARGTFLGIVTDESAAVQATIQRLAARAMGWSPDYLTRTVTETAQFWRPVE